MSDTEKDQLAEDLMDCRHENVLLQEDLNDITQAYNDTHGILKTRIDWWRRNYDLDRTVQAMCDDLMSAVWDEEADPVIFINGDYSVSP